VRDVEPHFRLTPANGPTVAAICQRLDALPLALELAAPWLKVLSADDLLDRLARDVLLSTVGRRDFPERHQTINATVAWSYQLLAPHEQRVFRRLGALPGRFPIEAAAAVLAGGDASSTTSDAEALSAVAGLIDKSLLLRAETLVPARARPLYGMLETVRAFAALELNAAGERDDALAGLSRYCASQAAVAAVGLVSPAQVEWLHRVREDLESYRGSLTWLLERGRAADAAHIASGLMLYWQIRGRSAEGLQWYEQILNLSSLPPGLESKALVCAAMMSYSLGDLERARTWLTRALALAHDAGDTDAAVQAEHLFGHVEHGVGNEAAARDRFTRSIEGFRALGIPWGLGNSLNGMAKVALATDNDAEAERLLDEATSVLQRCPWFLALALYRRAILAVRRENADEAIALVRECLTLFRALHDKFAIVYVTIPLAAAAVLKGDYAWAARILGARDAVTERTGASVADKWVRDMGERAEREARARLGPDRWARAYAAGRVTSMDSWIKEIDGALRKAQPPPQKRRNTVSTR
jgi:tetratricopeptide (TPR) repeat protein